MLFFLFFFVSSIDRSLNFDYYSLAYLLAVKFFVLEREKKKGKKETASKPTSRIFV